MLGKIFNINILDKIFKTLKIFAIAIFVVFELYLVLAFVQESGLIGETAQPGSKNIAVINIDKPITAGYVNLVMKKMDEIKEQSDLYAETLITFNSPGGNPAASEELSYYLDDFQKTMPTTFYISSSATSGAYMIACVSDTTLYSSPSALVGSVGVYVSVWSAEEALSKIGLKDFTEEFASHPDKIPFSFSKDPNAHSIEYVQKNLIQPIYSNFFNFVKDQRGLDEETLTKYAEGRAYIASEVVGVLVDEIKPIHAVKEGIEKKYENSDVFFVNTNLAPPKGLFASNFNIDLNVDMPKVGFR